MANSVDLQLAKCGLLLGTHYEIIEKCLVNLDNRQLTAVARVCRSWNKVARKIINKRRRPLSLIAKVQIKKELSDSISNLLKESFQHTLGYASSQCFIMATENVADQDFSGLTKLVSPSCKSLVIPGDGIIGTNLDGSVKAFITKDHKAKFYIGLSGVLFPDVPGVKIYTFFKPPIWNSLNGEEFHSWDNVMDPDGKTGRFIDIVPADETIKCAVFATFMNAEAGHGLYNFITERQDEPFAFGGYMSNEGTSYFVDDGKSTCRKESEACGFLITGENVTASSVVMKTQKEKDIKDCFEMLKACNFPDKNTICLLFSCVGRNKIKKEVETYHTMFPNIPLSGCTGYGEFGVNHLPNLVKSSQAFAPKKARLEENVGFGYSSIYVMIHWQI